MEPSRSASSPAVPRRPSGAASFVSPSANFLYTVDFLNDLQSPSVSSKLPRSPSTPGRVPTTFNPDDFFASPPAAAAASASVSARRVNSININLIPEGSTNALDNNINNTPQCKRRLFLEASNGNGNINNGNTNTPVRQVLASPAGSAASLFNFGNLDTPRVASASGKKRSRRFPSTDHVPPPFTMFSPHRNVLPPATSILMPSPKLFQTPKDGHSNEPLIGTDNEGKDIGLSMTLTPKSLDKTLLHTPKDSIVPSAAAAMNVNMNMTMVTSAPAACSTAIQLEEGSSTTLLATAAKPKRSQIFMTPITPHEAGGTCRCKASRCLKLYCPCFAASGLCSGACSCKNCQNTQYTSKIIQEARNTVLQRDPKAFDPKVRPVYSGNKKTTTSSSIFNNNGNDNSRGIHSKGCNCRKGCAKNYCVCRELRVACGPRCTCSGPNGCLNGKDCEDSKCNANANGNINIALPVTSVGIANNGAPLRPPVLPAKSEPIVAVLKRVSSVPIDALRANTHNSHQGIFKHIRTKQQHAHAPLFPAVTPEKMKTDMLALASSPATRSPRVRSVARIQHGNGNKINFSGHEMLMGSMKQQDMQKMQLQNVRPPRILRVKMGSGRALRKLSIGNMNIGNSNARAQKTVDTDYTG